MKEQLIQYVNLLFAGAQDCEEIKQEILQNTLDRYDDLIAEGKVPEAAYRLAISGIGDIHEILGGTGATQSGATPGPLQSQAAEEDPEKKRNRAIAIGIYIIAIIPLVLLESLGLDIIGLSLTLILVAIATYILIQNSNRDEEEEKREKVKEKQTPLQKSVRSLISTVGLVTYFLISFATQAWHLTWLIFPIIGAVQGLVRAIMDLKEANKQ